MQCYLPRTITGSLGYFASRNDNNQSIISYALIDMNKPESVLEYAKAPF